MYAPASTTRANPSTRSSQRYFLTKLRTRTTGKVLVDIRALIFHLTKADGPDVTVSNRGIITPSLQAKVPKKLSNKTQYLFILDELKTGSFLSIFQLCDDDCIVIFSKFNVKIFKNNRIIITGTRNNHILWSITLQSPTSPTPKVSRRSNNMANGVIRLRQTKKGWYSTYQAVD